MRRRVDRFLVAFAGIPEGPRTVATARAAAGRAREAKPSSWLLAAACLAYFRFGLRH